MRLDRWGALAAAAVLAVGIGTFSAAVQAATVVQVADPTTGSLTWDGNDCSGRFGQGFQNCAYKGSPIIAKFDVGPNNTLIPTLNTTAFPGLSAAWFTIDPVNKTWKYDPQGAGPGITAFTSKAGNDFFVYEFSGGPYYGGSTVFSFATPGNRGLSHISFYDTTTVIPLPAAAWLLLSGLAGFGLLARYQRAVA